jgi:hypothetical protein
MRPIRRRHFKLVALSTVALCATVTSQARAQGEEEGAGWAAIVALLTHDPSVTRPSDKRASDVASALVARMQRMLPLDQGRALASEALAQNTEHALSMGQPGARWAYTYSAGTNAVAKYRAKGRDDFHVEMGFPKGADGKASDPLFVSTGRYATMNGRRVYVSMETKDGKPSLLEIADTKADGSYAGEVIHRFDLLPGKRASTLRATWQETRQAASPLSRSIRPTEDVVSVTTASGYHIAPRYETQVVSRTPRSGPAPRAPRAGVVRQRQSCRR